ncbi:feruloyl-CoA synthase [Pseudoroseicyclus tamaricis]|uniref:Feruloyl-CoA synthase n=1 Tax=Pseudoroseicyclus tamaricis TaxID=2705421 RepID=A0A6B2JRX1_9RHOB|nr:feruloyl-CoA synthase [Pseudoroseicyclus tamaricis]NDV00948.1 feruloyl-CoA synthase [Pseudoroseicyclus tamaricis]
MSDEAPMRAVELWEPKIGTQTRPDGTTLVWREDPLGPYPERLSDRILHWAEVAPGRPWMKERAADGGWVSMTYGELAEAMARVGTALLDLGLTVERPLMILSGNSLEHAVAALSAQYVGIPSAAVAPAYALVSQDYAKLRDIAGQITPGAVFVKEAGPFARAISAVFDADVPVIAMEGEVPGRVTHRWAELMGTPATEAAEAARAATGPDTVAKFLFTSGTTGSPKAVIQTQRMLCANMEQVLDCYAWLRGEPPVLVDWAPWNHVASGTKVFNIALYNGGTFHIDAGKPTPDGMKETIRNLREIAPTWYFNVPAGFEMLIEAMERDDALRETFFSRVKMLLYAGAGMAGHTWRRLEELAVQTIGRKVLMSAGLGSTETAPFAIFCTEPQPGPGNCGVPAQGVVLKLVPSGDKLEARFKGPNVTPGYWRAEKLSADAFDEEGYYCMGDALRFAVPGKPEEGFFFDGRIAENFKLRTGTWVAVGALRAKLIDAMDGLIRDAVIAGEDQEELGALLIPFRPGMEKLVEGGGSLTDEALFAHPAVMSRLAELLGKHAQDATGSSSRVMRALVLTEPLRLDAGEVTDKGSVNQRAVLRHRGAAVEALYGEGPEVIHAGTPAREAKAR